MSSYKRGRWSGRKTAGFTRPTAQPTLQIPTCGFCSMRSLTRCEMPGCDVGLCRRHIHRKGGGNLCFLHRNAKLLQHIGVPAAGAVPIEGKMSKKFGPRGPALPWNFRIAPPVDPPA